MSDQPSARNWEECDKCGGTSQVVVWRPGRDPGGREREYRYDCPNCLNGLVPPAHKVEAVSDD